MLKSQYEISAPKKGAIVAARSMIAIIPIESLAFENM